MKIYCKISKPGVCFTPCNKNHKITDLSGRLQSVKIGSLSCAKCDYYNGEGGNGDSKYVDCLCDK